MTRHLALCADDYGQSPAICLGIERLAGCGRLTDVSCLVTGPAWPTVARRLDAAQVRVGLHLNLSEGRPLTTALAAHWPVFPGLPRLIVLAHLHRLPMAAVGEEWRAQIDAFEQARGHTPAHLDGHQHVHHLPQLRELLPPLLAPRPGMRVRHTGHVVGPGFAFKRALIEGTGGRRFGRTLDALGVARNAALAGVYDFRGDAYRRLMQGWLAALPATGGLVFCHPGDTGAGDDGDVIAPARRRELAYLGSAAFAEDLEAAGTGLDFAQP